jgi:surfeit locus 1 family protein
VSARRSLLSPTVGAAFGLAVLLSLGTWQVERLRWKEGLIAARQAAIHAPPVPVPRNLDAAQGLDFHPVRAQGQFLDRVFPVLATGPGGAGHHFIVPLRLADGAILLVDRGFVPDGRDAPTPEGEVAVTGLLRLPPAGRPGWFVPDNRPARNEWFYLDIPAMAAAAGLSPVLPFSVDADATRNPGGYPIGGQSPVDLPNNHLQYAITWYALALGLVGVYILLVRRHLQR